MPGRTSKIVIAGLLGGFAGNAVLGALFSSAPLHAILYNPSLQSRLFLEITPLRNIPASVAGLVILSIIHGWLFALVSRSIPGTTWLARGAFFGLVTWLMYWVFQEWFIYNTLLGEPILLNLVELAVLLVGSVVEGILIAFVLREWPQRESAAHAW